LANAAKSLQEIAFADRGGVGVYASKWGLPPRPQA